MLSNTNGKDLYVIGIFNETIGFDRWAGWHTEGDVVAVYNDRVTAEAVCQQRNAEEDRKNWWAFSVASVHEVCVGYLKTMERLESECRASLRAVALDGSQV
ncbi:MAG: hypothetical protein MN733_32960 [Nitrososphaera sp.]|nr:hypothetical protein [Nitrososphaera sp.]